MQLAGQDRSRIGPEWLELLAAVGIYPDRPFAPGEALAARLQVAVVVGAATRAALDGR
jgi:hypothetical protein